MGSIIYQVERELKAQLRAGESRHRAKKSEGTHAPEGIFSYGTLRTYLKQACHFARWAKETHGCNTLVKARPYVEEYLRLGIQKGLSVYTISTRRAALCKLYHCTGDDWDIKIPERKREAIERSRGVAKRDKGFSCKNNTGIIDFCRGTGLRRYELAAVKPANLLREDGRLYLVDIVGKGGKVRRIEVLPEYEAAVLKTAEGKAPGERIFPSIPSHMDVHGYRREYVQALYDRLARSVKDIPIRERYVCRND